MALRLDWSMGQAKIKRNRQRAEAEKRKANGPIPPMMERPARNATITSEQFLRLVVSSQEQGIKIDYEGVPLAKRSDALFCESYQQMYDEITDLYWVSAFCIHEAGHRLYLAPLGITEFDYLPPTIKYNEKIGDYDGHRAAVQAKEFNLPDKMPLDQFIWMFAKGLAAGAVLAEHLANAPRNGEEGDRERFTEDCSKILKTYPQLASIDADSAWTQAKNAILQEMKNPANKESVFETAEQVKADIFPWIKAPITPFPKPVHS